MRRFIILMIVSILLAACGSSAPDYHSLPPAGRALFASGANDAVACSACHAIDETPKSGPSLKGIAGRAGTRVAGQSAEEYLFNAIVSPNAFIVPGYNGGLMPGNFGKGLTLQQLRDLISYLMTLG